MLARVKKYFLKLKIGKWIFIGCEISFILFFILNLLLPLKVNIEYSQIITASDGSVIHAFLTRDQKWRMMTEQNEITPQLKKAILYKEDKYFYFHYGVNPFAITRAVFNNVFHLKRTSGASTITMQVARMLDPKERTYFNKTFEMFRATQLEIKYSKDEILRMYLNLVPYGGNIEGVKSASLLYFGRMPDKLSLAQITTLAVIPNRPVSLAIGKNNYSIVQARNKWLRRMMQDHLFATGIIKDALSEPLECNRMESPKLAPHFAYRMHTTYPDVPVIKTTLNKSKQQKIAGIAYNYCKRLKNSRINNAAVIVVNNKTKAVEAYLGSQDFFDTENSGQVDGVRAVRSPGSTLKPLVYALAFDKGLLTPKSVIADVPINFDGYSPENFNGKYNGNVSVEKSLAYSLNIPAVKTLKELGLPVMIDKMKQADFNQVKQAVNNSLGLSVVLGGCGVRLEELTNMYSAFANYGRFSKLNFLKDDTITGTTELVSPPAAYMISVILSSLTRPDMPNNFESSLRIPKVAWKTGTSYGRRDAWSIGYNRDYTVGVWVGNFSGEGVPELTGADMATPLLFEIFNSIDYNTGNDWFTVPEGLDFRLVCPETGKVPNDFCENTVIDYFIPKVSSTEKCDHLKKVFVSADEKFSYCTSCMPARGYKEVYYPNLAPDLISFYDSEHISYKKIPPHNDHCDRIFAEHPPRITSPVADKEYIVEKGEGQIALNCHVDNEVKTVYWYINDRLYKSSSPAEKVFFSPSEGEIKISCSDDKGRNVDIRVKVKYL